MKFIVVCLFVLAAVSIAYSQDESSTEATNQDGGVKPDTAAGDGQNPKPRQLCPSFIRFFGSERGFGFGGRKPTTATQPGDFDLSSYNPTNFNPSNYNPYYGRRFWTPFQGRRGGNRGGFGGPTYDIPDRDDVEFV